MIALLAKPGCLFTSIRARAAKKPNASRAAVERSGVQATARFILEGSFAGFAAIIAAAPYTSATIPPVSTPLPHAASRRLPSSLDPAPRMFERWRPVGANCKVIRVDDPDPVKTLAEVKTALES